MSYSTTGKIIIFDIHILKSPVATGATENFSLLFLEHYLPLSPFISGLSRDEMSLCPACP